MPVCHVRVSVLAQRRGPQQQTESGAGAPQGECVSCRRLEETAGLAVSRHDGGSRLISLLRAACFVCYTSLLERCPVCRLQCLPPVPT
ncbi:unnamed protein product [Boreogadus saida]